MGIRLYPSSRLKTINTMSSWWLIRAKMRFSDRMCIRCLCNRHHRPTIVRWEKISGKEKTEPWSLKLTDSCRSSALKWKRGRIRASDPVFMWHIWSPDWLRFRAGKDSNTAWTFGKRPLLIKKTQIADASFVTEGKGNVCASVGEVWHKSPFCDCEGQTCSRVGTSNICDTRGEPGEGSEGFDQVILCYR